MTSHLLLSTKPHQAIEVMHLAGLQLLTSSWCWLPLAESSKNMMRKTGLQNWRLFTSIAGNSGPGWFKFHHLQSTPEDRVLPQRQHAWQRRKNVREQGLQLKHQVDGWELKESELFLVGYFFYFFLFFLFFLFLKHCFYLFLFF